MHQYKTLFLFCLCSSLIVGCSTYRQARSITVCEESQNNSGNFSKAFELQAIMDEMIRSGVPGVALAVYSNEGWWQYATG